jgi:serine/threonine protein kinase
MSMKTPLLATERNDDALASASGLMKSYGDFDFDFFHFRSKDWEDDYWEDYFQYRNKSAVWLALIEISRNILSTLVVVSEDLSLNSGIIFGMPAFWVRIAIGSFNFIFFSSCAWMFCRYSFSNYVAPCSRYFFQAYLTIGTIVSSSLLTMSSCSEFKDTDTIVPPSGSFYIAFLFYQLWIMLSGMRFTQVFCVISVNWLFFILWLLMFAHIADHTVLVNVTSAYFVFIFIIYRVEMMNRMMYIHLRLFARAKLQEEVNLNPFNSKSIFAWFLGNGSTEVKSTGSFHDDLRVKSGTDTWDLRFDDLIQLAVVKDAPGRSVYKARYKTQLVAMKELYSVNMQDDDVEEFANECNVIFSLSQSPNVVRFFGISKSENSCFLITEWCNYNLKEVLSVESCCWPSGVQTVDNASARLLVLSVAHQIASAMEFLHKCDVVHLDLKPANVLVAGIIPGFRKKNRQIGNSNSRNSPIDAQMDTHVASPSPVMNTPNLETLRLHMLTETSELQRFDYLDQITIKLCDFGLSRNKSSAPISRHQVLGTALYMAPEILNSIPSILELPRVFSTPDRPSKDKTDSSEQTPFETKLTQHDSSSFSIEKSESELNDVGQDCVPSFQRARSVTRTTRHCRSHNLSLDQLKALDVYAFGILLCDLLTNDQSYADELKRLETPERLLQEVRDLATRPFLPACPPSLKPLIQRCLNKRWTKRPTFATLSSQLFTLIRQTSLEMQFGNRNYEGVDANKESRL